MKIHCCILIVGLLAAAPSLVLAKTSSAPGDAPNGQAGIVADVASLAVYPSEIILDDGDGDPDRVLNLVYNPQGPSLPPPQGPLPARARRRRVRPQLR